MDQVHAALDATPEQQYLDEGQAAEFQAWDQTMAVELTRRGRMMSMLAFSPESPNIDYAITNQGFASTAGDASLPEPLTVIADMRVMTAAQVARCLRAM